MTKEQIQKKLEDIIQDSNLNNNAPYFCISELKKIRDHAHNLKSAVEIDYQ